MLDLLYNDRYRWSRRCCFCFFLRASLGGLGSFLVLENDTLHRLSIISLALLLLLFLLLAIGNVLIALGSHDWSRIRSRLLCHDSDYFLLLLDLLLGFLICGVIGSARICRRHCDVGRLLVRGGLFCLCGRRLLGWFLRHIGTISHRQEQGLLDQGLLVVLIRLCLSYLYRCDWVDRGQQIGW